MPDNTSVENKNKKIINFSDTGGQIPDDIIEGTAEFNTAFRECKEKLALYQLQALEAGLSDETLRAIEKNVETYNALLNQIDGHLFNSESTIGVSSEEQAKAAQDCDFYTRVLEEINTTLTSAMNSETAISNNMLYSVAFGITAIFLIAIAATLIALSAGALGGVFPVLCALCRCRCICCKSFVRSCVLFEFCCCSSSFYSI